MTGPQMVEGDVPEHCESKPIQSTAAPFQAIQSWHNGSPSIAAIFLSIVPYTRPSTSRFRSSNTLSAGFSSGTDVGCPTSGNPTALTIVAQWLGAPSHTKASVPALCHSSTTACTVSFFILGVHIHHSLFCIPSTGSPLFCQTGNISISACSGH